MSRLVVRQRVEDRLESRTLGRWLRVRVLALPSHAADFDVRGFGACPGETRQTLERHGSAFVAGFNAALAAPGGEELVERLADLPRPEWGFGYEGAAMALGVLGTARLIRPWRLREFLRGAGDPYRYLIHVGCGWAMARLHRRRPRLWRTLDPLLRWLAFDGWGFHDGFFHPAKTIDRQRRPRRLRGYEPRAFDQGVGCSLWFVTGANPEAIAVAVQRFDRDRQADLWSGVGLAATYAGGVPADALRSLVSAAGPYTANLAQGAAFAAKARVHGGNVVPATELAVTVLCNGASVLEVADLTDRTYSELYHDGSADDYERWRATTRTALE